MAIVSLHAQENMLLDREFWSTKPGIEKIQHLIDDGHSPTAMTTNGFDAVTNAIFTGNPNETIDFLLSQDNDINKLTHDARTYVFWAASNNNLELLKHLIAKGARTDIVDQHGYTLLLFAAATGQRDKSLFEFIMQQGDDVKDEVDHHGKNVLLVHAGSMKNLDLLPFFIEKGISIESKDEDGNGIFHFAARSGDVQLLKKLISIYNIDQKPNPKTSENAFHFAASRRTRSGESSTIEMYQFLETLGLDATAINNKGESPLHLLAKSTRDSEIFKYFLSKGVDATLVDHSGNTAFMNAASNNMQEIIQLLLTDATDINQVDGKGFTALSHAIKGNKKSIAAFLIQKGASTNVKDESGTDLGFLLINAVDGRTNIEEIKGKMQLLIREGYDPKRLDTDGNNLLHVAVSKNNLELVKYLLDLGVPVNQKDQSGQTALHLAAMNASNAALMKLLLESGADLEIKTDFDESAHDLAAQNEMLIKNQINIDFLKGK